MKQLFRDKEIYILIVLISIMALAAVGYIYKSELNGPPIRSDGKGYYAYLPSFFIDHSFNIQIDENTPYWYELDNGKIIDKYPMGTAILQIPFFLIAHLYVLFRDSSAADGWSGPYQILNILSAIFYYSIGIFFVFKILKRYFSSRISMLCCILISLGTNLFHYFTYDASFSHVYSFAMLAAFLYYLITYEEQKDNWRSERSRILHLMIFGVLAGIIFMVRNTNFIYVILYIFYGADNIESLKKRICNIIKPRNSLPIIFAGIVTIMPQLVYWKMISGHFLFRSYPEQEVFEFLRPHILNVLFSVRKGALFWCPLLIFSIIGIGIRNNRLKKIRLASVIFFILNLYIIASWSCWPYGGSLGQRPFVDSYSLIAVYLANFIEAVFNLAKKFKYGVMLKVTVFLMFLLILIWNICITWGYWVQLIPYDGTTWDTLKRFMIQMIG